MKNGKISILLFVMIIFSSCSGFESLEVREIQEFKFTGFENNSINVNIKVPIHNPNTLPVKIKGMDMKAYYKGRPLGYLTSDEKIIIKGKTDQVYSIPVAIKITNVLQGLSLMSNSSNINAKDFSFKGTINVKYLLIARNYEVSEDMLKQYFK